MTKASTHTQGWGIMFALFLVGAGLTGCSTSSGDGSNSASTLEPAFAGTNTPILQPDGMKNSEILNVGDSLTIVYSDLPILQPPFEGQIKADGTITLFENKTFQAAGKNRSQLEQEIRDRYVPSYFKRMTVTIKLQQETRLYYVGGQVRSPGRQVYLSRTTVLKAIQSAGDFTDWANRKKVKLTRSDGRRTQVIDTNKVLRGDIPDVEVYPGDSIYVPKKIW